MTPNPKSSALSTNVQPKKKEFSLQTYSQSSVNRQRIETSDIFKGPSFKCYENKLLADRETQEADRAPSKDEYEIEISMEMGDGLENKSIGSDLFKHKREAKTSKAESSVSDINLSSLKQSCNEVTSAQKLAEHSRPRSKTSNESLEDKTGRSTLQEESEDITLTMVSNSQQLSSQMNLRPSIQFMNQEVTEDFQMSDNKGSPFITRIKGIMGESMKHPGQLGEDKTALNHKFSYSEDLTNIFNQINPKSGPGKAKGMETIRDTEGPAEDPKTPTFMKMEFFRTLGDEKEDDKKENENKAHSLDNAGPGVGKPHASNEEKKSNRNKKSLDGWGSEDDFVDRSKFLDSKNFRSSRQML